MEDGIPKKEASWIMKDTKKEAKLDEKDGDRKNENEIKIPPINDLRMELAREEAGMSSGRLFLI